MCLLYTHSSNIKLDLMVWFQLMDGFSGGVWGGSNPPGSDKHPPRKCWNPPRKIENPPRNFTDFQYSQLQFKLFHYDEIILTAKA